MAPASRNSLPTRLMQTDDRGLAGGHGRSRAGGGEHLPPVSVEVSGLGAIHVEIGHDTRQESTTAPKEAASAASTKEWMRRRRPAVAPCLGSENEIRRALCRDRAIFTPRVGYRPERGGLGGVNQGWSSRRRAARPAPSPPSIAPALERRREAGPPEPSSCGLRRRRPVLPGLAMLAPTADYLRGPTPGRLADATPRSH